MKDESIKMTKPNYENQPTKKNPNQSVRIKPNVKPSQFKQQNQTTKKTEPTKKNPNQSVRIKPNVKPNQLK